MIFALVDFLQDTPAARGLVRVHPGGRDRTYLNEYCVTVGSHKTTTTTILKITRPFCFLVFLHFQKDREPFVFQPDERNIKS